MLYYSKMDRKCRLLNVNRSTYKQPNICTNSVWRERVWEKAIKKRGNGGTERMIWALKHLEGDRKRIVKCKKERGRMREKNIGRG